MAQREVVTRAARYDANRAANLPGLHPCYVCGKGIRAESIAFVLCVDPSTNEAMPWQEVEDVPGAACYPVGYDCMRKRVELRRFMVRRRVER
jgi:hypothetical protein